MLFLIKSKGVTINMNHFVKNHPVIIFSIGAFLLSGILILLNIFVFRDAQNYAIIFPQLAPGIIGILLSQLIRDGKGKRINIKRFHITKENIKWFALCVIVSILIIGLSYLILSLFKYGYLVFPAFEIHYRYIYILLGIIMGSLGEEVGWRGFMLPQLQLKYSPLISSIVLGLVWGAWHLNMEVGIVGFLLFIITTIELSILFTWFNNKTKGNILIAVVFHSIINILSRALLLSDYGIRVFVIEIIVFGIGCILVLTFSDLKNQDIRSRI